MNELYLKQRRLIEEQERIEEEIRSVSRV